MKKKYKTNKLLKKLLILFVVVGLIWFRQEIVNNLSALISDQEFKAQSDNQIDFPKVKSSEAILINLETNEVIAQKKAKKTIYPASLTKIMTALVAIEQTSDLTGSFSVPEGLTQGLNEEGAALAGFFETEKVTVIDLLYGTMLPSGADATITLAQGIAGSEEAFVELMNEKAQELKLSDTHFTNATGLHHRQHVTTVADLSTLLKEALKNPTFRTIFTTKEYIHYSDYQPNGLVLTSRLFGNIASSTLDSGQILGGKTGYTPEAGLCLASLAEVDDVEYLLVTAGADGKPNGTQWHIEDAFSIYQSI